MKKIRDNIKFPEVSEINRVSTKTNEHLRKMFHEQKIFRKWSKSNENTRMIQKNEPKN